MKIIIWLGNPGREYENTRHNVGYLLVDRLQEVSGFSDWTDSRFSWVMGEGNIGWEKVILLKPTTYMNLSWESVAKIVNFYKIDSKKDILVLVDDLDMEFAKVRYRSKGSAGGQNWLKSIIAQLGNEEFARIKIGIGRDERYSVSDWVLSKFKKDELETLKNDIFPMVHTKIEEWIQNND